MAADHDPTAGLFLPGHRVTANDPFAALVVFLNGKNKILDNGDIVMDADVNGAQFSDGDLGRLGPKAHPFIKPRTVDVDGALMSEAEKFRMNVF